LVLLLWVLLLLLLTPRVVEQDRDTRYSSQQIKCDMCHMVLDHTWKTMLDRPDRPTEGDVVIHLENLCPEDEKGSTPKFMWASMLRKVSDTEFYLVERDPEEPVFYIDWSTRSMGRACRGITGYAAEIAEEFHPELIKTRTGEGRRTRKTAYQPDVAKINTRLCRALDACPKNRVSRIIPADKFAELFSGAHPEQSGDAAAGGEL
jgi:hypothetical protein